DGDLRDLDRVREPGAEVVVLGRDEHLALARQPPPGPRMLHTVEVALEAEPVRVGLLARHPVAGADGTRRPRCQRGGELGLAPLTRAEPPADEGVGVVMRALHRDTRLDDHRFHGPRVPAGCDRYAVPAGPPAPRAAWAAAKRASGTRYGDH